MATRKKPEGIDGTVARPPRIVFQWIFIKTPKARARRLGVPAVRTECVWALQGGNGEHMCGSWPEGFRDETDARRNLDAVAKYLAPGSGAVLIPAPPKPTHHNGEPLL